MKSTLLELNPKFLSSGGEGISDSNGNPVPITKNAALDMDCPCGCRDRVCVPLVDGHHARWSIDSYDFNILTLSPSVQRRSGCNSHFSIINGKVVP